MNNSPSSSGHILHNLVLFGRLLRQLGLDVNPGRMIDLVIEQREKAGPLLGAEDLQQGADGGQALALAQDDQWAAAAMETKAQNQPRYAIDVVGVAMRNHQVV